MVQVASFLIIATLIGLNSTKCILIICPFHNHFLPLLVCLATADGEEHHARVRIVGGSHAQAGQFTYQVL